MKYAFYFFVVLAFVSCSKLETTSTIDEAAVESLSITDLNVPEGFTFETTGDLLIRVSALNNLGLPITQLPVDISAVMDGVDEPVFLQNGFIGPNGLLEANIIQSAHIQKLLISSPYPGMPSQEITLNGQSTIDVRLGENNRVDDRSTEFSRDLPNFHNGVSDRSVFQFLGTFNSQGVPNYLLPQGDVVPKSTLDMIAASLPEGKPVPQFNSNYIATGTETNTNLTDSADIWVTFVHEGAGYRNSVGYYTYPTNQPPTTAAQLSALKVIFPNTSFVGSGGGLRTGDKVWIGRFGPGTTIGWFVVPNGWTGSTVSDATKKIHFSNPILNTFTSSTYRSHVVQLLDAANQRLLLGFEDIARPAGDNDFNDAIFLVSANPFSAVNTTNMIATKAAGPDADGDGVSDNMDVEPNNPSVAFVAHFPGLNQYATLAFEDMFPRQGDFDMNDVVVDYNVTEYLSSTNKIAKINAKYVLRALGGSFRNGFGVELPVDASLVKSVTGGKKLDNYISLLPSGVEAGQAKAVYIPFDNGHDLMKNYSGAFVNTDKGTAPVPSQIVEMNLIFNSLVTRTQLGCAPYNPFIIVNRNRGTEVHLPGHKPTSLANSTLFGTANDDTKPTTGKYYQTKSNLPYAIQLPTSFAYPSSGQAINKAYSKFNEWAQSGGTNYPDWFMDKTNYRDYSKIY